MQFTKAEEYGLFGVLYLAEINNSKIVPLSEISKSQKIPEKFLAKIFQSLCKNGVVRSHRGVRGGFTLAKDATEISMKEVLETIQGPYRLMKCTEDISLCDRNFNESCAVRKVLIKAEESLISVFEQYSLADLVEWQQSGREPHRSAAV